MGVVEGAVSTFTRIGFGLHRPICINGPWEGDPSPSTLRWNYLQIYLPLELPPLQDGISMGLLTAEAPSLELGMGRMAVPWGWAELDVPTARACEISCFSTWDLIVSGSGPRQTRPLPWCIAHGLLTGASYLSRLGALSQSLDIQAIFEWTRSTSHHWGDIL